MSQNIAIVGIGETPTARSLPQDLPELVIMAIEAAAADAGIEVSQIDGVITENLVSPGIMFDLVTAFGWSPEIFSAQVGLTGAGTMNAPALARLAIDAGLAKYVVCYFGVDWGSDVGAFTSHHSKDSYKSNFEMPYGYFPQPVYMATMAQRYLATYGYQPDDLAMVPITQRRWAAMHPAATKRNLLTLESYRRSAPVADPFRNADCALLSDGAAAFIMTSETVARDLKQKPVIVAGCSRAIEHATEHDYLSVRPEKMSLPSKITGPSALRQAGITAADIDVYELYDCFSIIPALQLEDIGLCERGEALSLYRDGVTGPGGRYPVNTHGGLLSHSYLLGISHLCEAVTQLRGDAGDRQVPGASTALVTGWSAPEHASLVLRS